MHLRIAVDVQSPRAFVGKRVERLAQTNSRMEVQALDPFLTLQAQQWQLIRCFRIAHFPAPPPNIQYSKHSAPQCSKHSHHVLKVPWERAPHPNVMATASRITTPALRAMANCTAMKRIQESGRVRLDCPAVCFAFQAQRSQSASGPD